jgi:3-methylcrotonyl-CoA carboxylase alpha subunit
MFSKILIANRGEIACRIMRTARRLNIRTVAVYSDADAHAMHVKLADEAYLLGPAPSRESYLRMDRIIAIARQSGAEAIHPGYGFLSENAAFSQACADNNIVFIGPSASAITAMGSKSGAKALMEVAGVPLIPGYHGEQQDDAHLLAAARSIGFPVLLKASAGGGGKGMRSVFNESEFSEALQAAKREALNAFGDERMLIEKLLLTPRHVEVQLMADRHGQAFYIFDRDCSLQRRHQKVVEEAPAPGLPDDLRRAMGEAAVRAALAIQYEGAGTIEFLVENNQFFFMEMNTRLQVEHPVTEMISGLDLVELQLRVASGERLGLDQKALRPDGHAVEVRLYAEDPATDFLPSTGTLKHFSYPANTATTRIDTGFAAGDVVSVHYDPMMAKVIAHGPTRELAISRLRDVLAQVHIAGVKHNTAFLHRVLGIPAFVAGQLSTRFLDEHRNEWAMTPATDPAALLAAAVWFHQQAAQRCAPVNSADIHSPWSGVTSWRASGRATEMVRLQQGENIVEVGLSLLADGKYRWRTGDDEGTLDFAVAPDTVRVTVNDMQQQYAFHAEPGRLHLYARGRHQEFTPFTPDFDPSHRAGGDRHYQAPMNGRVVHLLVSTGQSVKKDETLLVMEAMKMEHRIRAHADGTVTAINSAAGELVNEGQRLLELEVAAS